MTIVADFLRDSGGTLWKVYPNADGELVVTDVIGYPDTEAWTQPTYLAPTTYQTTYRTLADSAGTTWYIYINTNGEVVISTTQPTTVDAGIWYDYVYGYHTNTDENEATTGNEIYDALEDVDGTDWYIYPNANGELIITTTEPS